MEHTNITYLDICELAPFKGDFSLYTRVKITNPTSAYHNKIGEIYNYDESGDTYEVHVSTSPVAGFALGLTLDIVYIARAHLQPLDHGLNSPFICDIEGLKKYTDTL